MNNSSSRYYQMLEEAPQVAKEALASIASIRALKLKNGWRYVAIHQDGSQEIIRANSTRLYGAAHLHRKLVCSGKTGLGSVFSFGQKATQPDLLMKSYPIAQEESK